MMFNMKVMFLFCYTIDKCFNSIYVSTNFQLDLKKVQIIFKKPPKPYSPKVCKLTNHVESMVLTNFEMDGGQEIIRNGNTLDERKMRLRICVPYS